jgi:hypothetical protein
MRRSHLVTLAAAAVLLTGCYHASVDTGLSPAPEEATQRIWANSWIVGLVKPAAVDATRLCGGRKAARVETQHTFLNQVVAMLTAGIYTPMTIEVTCATE